MNQRTMNRDEVREIDRRAIEEYGIPGIVLMENAGRGAAELLIELGINGPVVVFAGRGNNAGDGFVMARHLEIRGVQVRVLLFCEPDELRGDAATNYNILARAGTPVRLFGEQFNSSDVDRELAGADWIVDALLGTGTRGEVREPYATVIRSINAAGRRVLAVDLPSGLDCNTGKPLGACVRADHTATFVARKTGFDAPESRPLTGQVHVIDIGIPRAMLE